MPTYTIEYFEEIAAAIGVQAGQVIQHQNRFEAAATWYRADSKNPQRVPPSTIKRQAKAIARAAKKLLRHLDVLDYRNAADGPGDFTLLEALASAEDGTEDKVVRAVERVGRLAEIFDAIDAIQLLKHQAERAVVDANQFSRLVPTGHRGDIPENEWIASMMSLYQKITARKASTSIIAPGQPEEGKPTGPVIRFLSAAGKPLGIKHSPHSWRC